MSDFKSEIIRFISPSVLPATTPHGGMRVSQWKISQERVSFARREDSELTPVPSLPSAMGSTSLERTRSLEGSVSMSSPVDVSRMRRKNGGLDLFGVSALSSWMGSSCSSSIAEFSSMNSWYDSSARHVLKTSERTSLDNHSRQIAVSQSLPRPPPNVSRSRNRCESLS